MNGEIIEKYQEENYSSLSLYVLKSGQAVNIKSSISQY